MRSSEWVIAVYFAYLIVAAVGRRLVPVQRRMRIASVGAAALAAVGLLASLRGSPALQGVRDWAPGLFLLLGYWLPGLFYTAPNDRLERWLMRVDARLFALKPVAGIATRAPRAALELLELSYLSCYALVPAIFIILYVSADRAAGIRFWRAVLLSEFICYGLLPWLPSRPPRTLERDAPIDRRGLTARCMNLWVLKRVSIQVNTFPSGHVAGSLIAAMIAWTVTPVLGMATMFIALMITVATVMGRYHYAADAVFGALVAVAIFALVLRF